MRLRLLIVIILGFVSQAFSQVKVPFSFTLSSQAKTSAGVYTPTGVLVRTLWSGVTYSAGSHTVYWDGMNDQKLLQANGSYEIRVLQNNVQYQWEGLIGNTSTYDTGYQVHHAFETIYTMAFSSTTCFYNVNYNEQLPAINTFSTTNPQIRTATLLSKGAVTKLVCTDGNYVYWDGSDANDTTSNFVYATKVSDNSEVTNFSSGSSVTVRYSRTYSSAIDVQLTALSMVTGLAVQPTGTYLFVAHSRQGVVKVLNKTTGALVQTITMTTPTAMACDNSNNLWVITGGNTVAKYTVNSDGTLTAATVTLSGLVAPIGVAVSTNGTTVSVVDGGTSQQIKSYDNSTGASSWTLGQAGGYATDPTVANDKFMFVDHDAVHGSIAYAADGSFWVVDPGNSRSMHFSAARYYIEMLMFLPHSYSSQVDPNNTTRVFSDYLEFSVDYTKDIRASGAWTLVKNWGYNIPTTYNDAYWRFKNLATLSNGRTYAFLRYGNNALALVELPATGQLRYTSIVWNSLLYTMHPDGSVRGVSGFSAGNPQVWTVQYITGFDTNNDPIYGTSSTLATGSPANYTDPNFWGNGNNVLTSNGYLVNFDAGKPTNGSSQYHLGGIKVGTTGWTWKTANSTFPLYSSVKFPSDGTYDLGNRVGNAGSYARALDSTIVWGYHGEFWQNSQVNKWQLVSWDGLFVGQFGATGVDYSGEAAPYMSGNAFAVSFVKGTDGNGYVYLNDESVHSGVHRWKITGLSAISEQKQTVALSAAATGLTASYYDSTTLNNTRVKTIHTESTISLTNSTVTLTTKVARPTNFSVKWEGFVKPFYNEAYTFYSSSNSGVRLWVNDSLIINGWSNASATELSSVPLTLDNSVGYKIRMEYFSNINSPICNLSWSSSSQAKQVIPTTSLYASVPVDTVGGFNLMEGLERRPKLLTDNDHGWRRYPTTDDSTSTYTQFWSVGQGYQSYDQFKTPDIFGTFTQPTGTYYIQRDLGKNIKLDYWRIKAKINFDYDGGNEPTGKGGHYVDILDDAGKYIARLYCNNFFASPYATWTIMGNNAQIATGYSYQIQPIWFDNQDLIIETTTSGKIKFTYGPYSSVTTSVYDPTANWKNPKTFQLQFYGNSHNYTRNADVQALQFQPFKTIYLDGNPTNGSNTPTDVFTDVIKFNNLSASNLYINKDTITTDTTSASVLAMNVTTGKVVDLPDSYVETKSHAASIYQPIMAIPSFENVLLTKQDTSTSQYDFMLVRDRNAPYLTKLIRSNIGLSWLTAASPLTYNNGNNLISMTQASHTASGWMSYSDWDTLNNKNNRIVLTSIGSTGPSTLIHGVNHIDSLNIPIYVSTGGVSNLLATAPLAYNSGTLTFSIDSIPHFSKMYLTNLANGSDQYDSVVSINQGILRKIRNPLATAASMTSFSAVSPMSYNSGNGVFSMTQATTSSPGWLTAADWNTFNGKQSALGYTPLNRTGDDMQGSLGFVVGGILKNGSSLTFNNTSNSSNGSISFDGTNLNISKPINTSSAIIGTSTGVVTSSGGTISNIGSGSNGQVVSNSGGTIGWTAPPSGANGKYTPTITVGTNVFASYPYTTLYSQNGNIVTVSGSIDIGITTTGTYSQLWVSLPIATTSTSQQDAAGTFSSPNGHMGGGINLNAGKAWFQFVPSQVSGFNDYFNFTFQYSVN